MPVPASGTLRTSHRGNADFQYTFCGRYRQFFSENRV
jgi:hypothetical protein